MTHGKLAAIILRAAIVLLAMVFAAQHLIADKSWLALLDNLHWTIGTVAASVLAWFGFSGSSGVEYTARRWFFIGLTAYMTGQLLWDIQTWVGWNPFPAPSDLFYLMLGPGCLFGLVAAMRQLLPKHNHRVIALDTAMMSIAILALTLTIYLPRSASVDLLALSVMVAYPVLLLSAGCFGFVMVLHFHPQAGWAWITFQAGLCTQGLVWMWWNIQSLSGSTQDGSFLNQFFSVASIVLGLSAMRWEMAPSANQRYAKWCEGVLRMLPLLAVVIAAIASLLVFSLRYLLPELREAVLFAALSVVALAVFRQSLMLEERQQLLEAEQALVESSRFLQLVMDTVPAGIFWKDRDLNFMGGNSSFAKDAGLNSIAELIGKNDFDMVWKEYAGSYRADDKAIMDSGVGKLVFDEHLNTADGGERWVRTSKVPLRNRDNEVIGLLGVYNDITANKKIEEIQRIAAVTFETQEAILVTDPEGKILRVNQAFQDMAGYSPEEVIGHNPRIFQSGRHDAGFYQAMWSELLGTGKWSGEIWDKRKNGDIFPKLMTITAVYDDQRQVTNYVSVSRDISNRKQSEQEIHQLAFYDPLTKLPNRRLLLDRLLYVMTAGARSGRYGALFFLDLDQFKTINDTQGHVIGDLLLVEVARRLHVCVREGDCVARLGGDEFVVVLAELNSHKNEAAFQAELVAEKVRRELGLPYSLDYYDCHSSASIGVCLFRGHQDSVDDLLKHADVAMYHAKAAGRNAIRFFDPEMQRVLEARMDMEGSLRSALKNQQLHLHYQLQVDSMRRPLGAEVLLRWTHPENGAISPMQFIPLAEDTGLILPIGLWVIQAACAQLKAWQDDPLACGLTLAVNVSGKQFRHVDFASQVQRALLESGANPALLKLELTESIVLENVEDTIRKMHEIKAMGVSFSMDDFGTGYSSLQYLKRLPLDQIKIDQSFVRDIATDPNDAVIVKTTIAMSDALGLHVIAEGVETEAQCEFLDQHGCHAFQGYLFSKPLSLDGFENQLKRGADQSFH